VDCTRQKLSCPDVPTPTMFREKITLRLPPRSKQAYLPPLIAIQISRTNWSEGTRPCPQRAPKSDLRCSGVDSRFGLRQERFHPNGHDPVAEGSDASAVRHLPARWFYASAITSIGRVCRSSLRVCRLVRDRWPDGLRPETLRRDRRGWLHENERPRLHCCSPAFDEQRGSHARYYRRPKRRRVLYADGQPRVQ
jgi:hypothetical protein